MRNARLCNLAYPTTLNTLFFSILQYIIFYAAKHGLLQGKRRSFTRQKTVFCKTSR